MTARLQVGGGVEGSSCECDFMVAYIVQSEGKVTSMRLVARPGCQTME